MVGRGKNGETREVEDANTWREHLSLRLARVLTVLYFFAMVLVAITMHGTWQGNAIVGVGCLGVIVAGVPAVTGKPKGTLRAWLLIGPSLSVALLGFALVGFLSGPAVVLTFTLMMAGLLLGNRVMLVLSVIVALGLCVIAWAMIYSVIPAPNARDISMTHAVPWLRTILVTFLAVAFLGNLLIEIVARMERSLAQAHKETRLREQADRAKAEAEIRSLEAKQLETIGRLAAGVAHDFNNNLTAIIGCAELLREDCSTDASKRELVDDILKSSRRAAELTGQLLAYARKAKIELVPTDIHQLLEAAVALLRRSIDPRVQVIAQLQAENSVVLADATLLENALLNLLVNARDAMPNGGQLTLATTTYNVAEGTPEAARGLSVGTHILIEVLDTGQGIGQEHLPKVFEPFFTTKPVGKGTGLGLSAVYGTIKTLSGSIEVESEPGCGTAFRIMLPCVAANLVSLKVETAFPVTGSGQILLVDDDVAVRKTAVLTLQSLGYEVTMASDGTVALELLRASPGRFDLVLLDLRMPKLSGEATFDELRKLAPTLPVLVWSGYGDEQAVAAMLRKGAVGFIQKPYRIPELSRLVEQAIHRKAESKWASNNG